MNLSLYNSFITNHLRVALSSMVVDLTIQIYLSLASRLYFINTTHIYEIRTKKSS